MGSSGFSLEAPSQAWRYLSTTNGPVPSGWLDDSMVSRLRKADYLGCLVSEGEMCMFENKQRQARHSDWQTENCEEA